MVINTQEHSVNDNSKHHKILEGLRLYYSETLKPKTIDRLHWNNFWISVHQESLYFDPLLLLVAEVITSLPLLNLLVEFINDNRNKQVHDEESCHENVHYVEQTSGGSMFGNG